MILGLIVTGIIALLLIFGLLKNTMESYRISTIGAIVGLALLVIANFIPSIYIGGVGFGWAGFIIPLLINAILVLKIGMNSRHISALLSALLIAAAFVPTALFLYTDTAWINVIVMIGFGILTGAIAFAIVGRGVGIPASIFGGVVWGSVAYSLVAYFTGYNTQIFIGGELAFGALMVTLLVGVLCTAIFQMMADGSSEYMTRRRSYSSEQSEEFDKEREYDNFFDED